MALTLRFAERPQNHREAGTLNRTLVIGIGNTLRGDDGAGIAVALRLRAELPEVDTIDVHELTPDIVEMVSTYECVVFVDASVEDSEVTIREAEEDNVSSPGGSHALSTGKVLALARTLYGRAPLRSLLAAVPGREFDFTEKLSPETARDVETCVALLRTLLAQSSA